MADDHRLLIWKLSGRGRFCRLHNTTGLSFGAHTGTWVQNTPYANASDPRAVGQWAYVDDPKHHGQKKLAFPQGPELYEHLFTANAKWKLELIKQDHITDNPQVDTR